MFIELHQYEDNRPILVNTNMVVALKQYGETCLVAFDYKAGTNLVATESYSEIKRMIRSGSN